MAKPKQVLLLIETSRVFGRGIMNGVSRYAKEHANWVFRFEDRGILESLPAWLRDWQGDGVIARSPTPSLSESIADFGCPVVELLGDGRTSIAEVRTDEALSAQMAIDHLTQQGYEHLAFYSFATSWWSNARRDAFEQVVRSRKLSGHVFPGAYKGSNKPYPMWRKAYQQSLDRWLDRLPKPVAIWTVADSQAIRILEMCRQRHLHVPSEVGILGTTNDEIVCGLLSPSLSSIDLNAAEVGYRAAALLDQKMRARVPKRWRRANPPVLIPPQGVVARESSNRIAILDPELHQAMQMIDREAAKGLTVEAIAEELLLSRSTLERRFRETLKCTPAEAISHARVERAKKLLLETTWPVSKIGSRVGFCSPENFVRFFRRIVGQTPRQYRNDLHGED